MTSRYSHPAFYLSSVFTLTFVFFFLLHTAFLGKNYRNSTEDAVIKITRGDNLRTVATKLEENQMIFNKYIFIALGRIFGYQNNIIPGEYKFHNGITPINILNTITNPYIIRSVTITIPEGLNIRQMARLLKRQIGVDSARFVEEAKNDSLVKLLGFEAGSLEGYLFPDTYQISFTGIGNREKEIISLLASQFRNKITGDMREQLKQRDMSLNDLVTMASIIEAETRFEPEKKTIAGVYYNRLKKKMKLEADPTVQYVLPDGPKRRLMYSDLRYPSPYNTYLNKGLPPGPINNPGLNSILAALYPEEHTYLYFVAKGDGSHRFAESYDEHKKNIQLYQQYLREQQKQKQEQNLQNQNGVQDSGRSQNQNGIQNQNSPNNHSEPKKENE